MAYNASYNKSSKKNPTIKLNEGKDAVFGIYLAEVVSTKDVSRTGRVRVFIPAISKDKNSTAGYFDAVWTSPFAGGTDPREVGTDINDPEQTISSYGFWATVPDNGNLVLVAFGDGNTKYPLIISCLFPDKFNYMIPSNAGSKTYQAPNLNLPTMEKNKRTADINHNDTFRPIQHTLAEGIVKQGLANDPIRGAGKATARRESPSEVFGILTPGPRDPNNFDHRLGGHSITMDDNLGSRQIRIRSAKGSQILLDDTTGMIYMINRDGTVWMEFSPSGDVFLNAEGDINLRAKKDFNLRADGDVNIEAGQNINLKAAKDNSSAEYLGEGQGSGGDIKIEAKADIHTIAQFNTFQTSIEGETHQNSGGSHHITTGGSMHNKVKQDLLQDVGKQFGTKAGSDVIFTAGGQIVEKATKVLMNSGGADPSAAKTAVTGVPITTFDLEDQPDNPPTYDRDSTSPVTSNGERTGNQATITTIVPVLVTAEPFEGHGLPDPAKDDQENMIPDESLVQSLPANSNGVSNTPADVNSPSGFQTGSYDSTGTPKYSSPAQLPNNFTLAQNKKIQEQTISQLTQALGSSIPTLRQPAISPRGAAKIGITGKLTALENKTKNVAFNLQGLPADLNSAEISRMRNLISAASQSGLAEQAIEGQLLSQGIRTIQDGGSKIYVNSSGSKIVDFKGGLGDVSSAMLASASLMSTANVIKKVVEAPISDNQMMALTSFANHIGPDNFAKSKVLQAVNSGNYAQVPNLMMEYTSLNTGGNATRQADYVQRRQFEGELFQSPDSVGLPGYKSRVSFARQAKDLAALRRGLS